MKLFGICPSCGYETEIDNPSAAYLMCGQCFEIYNIMGDAKIEGSKLSTERKQGLIKEIEKDVSHRVSNWRNI